MTDVDRVQRAENSFDTLTGILRHTLGCKNLGEAMRKATVIINEGFLLEYHGTWEYDEYSDSMVCTACYEKALVNPDAPDEVMLTDFCPHCGARMN